MEDAQARVQRAVTSMFQDLDKDVIRKMQVTENVNKAIQMKARFIHAECTCINCAKLKLFVGPER